MVRILCTTHQEADAIWRLWLQASEPCSLTAELLVADHLVAVLSSGGDGCSAPHAVPQGHSCQAPDPAGR